MKKNSIRLKYKAILKWRKRVIVENIIVKIQDASVSLKNFTLHSANIEIPEGFITGITGANGAGKTTFIQMVLGCFPKMNGTVTINGSDVIQERQKALAMTGVISEKRTFYEEEDALKNEEYFSSFYENWDKEIYREYLKKMNIPPSKAIGNLSKGERIKFQLAFSAAYKPALLIMDEPASGLDPVFRTDFFKILQEFVAEYMSAIIISDNVTENLEQIADYLITIENGECSWKEAI